MGVRVGLVVYGSLARVSGGYLYDRMLVQHLQRAGDEVQIFPCPPGRTLAACCKTLMRNSGGGCKLRGSMCCCRMSSTIRRL